MKLTQQQAQDALNHAPRYVSNRRHYVRAHGVSYSVAALVWCAHTGEWPAKTPRHLDNDPSNNDFANLRPPGRAPRKKTEVRLPVVPREPYEGPHQFATLTPKELKERNLIPTLSESSVFVYDAQAQEAAKKITDLLGNRV